MSDASASGESAWPGPDFDQGALTHIQRCERIIKMRCLHHRLLAINHASASSVLNDGLHDQSVVKTHRVSANTPKLQDM
jgi:hypothetical protein